MTTWDWGIILGCILLVLLVAGTAFACFVVSARADDDDIDWEP